LPTLVVLRLSPPGGTSGRRHQTVLNPRVFHSPSRHRPARPA
jgi:hypothetical protein